MTRMTMIVLVVPERMLKMALPCIPSENLSKLSERICEKICEYENKSHTTIHYIFKNK